MPRQIIGLINTLKLSKQQGFTLVEVMVAFTVVVFILIGTITSITASMNLNTRQKQRALAQDLVRDVMGKYVKSVDYDAREDKTTYDTASEDINPFNDSSSMASDSTITFTKVLYDAGANPVTNNLPNGLNSNDFVQQLNKLPQAKLEVVFSKIKQTSTKYYSTKINAVVRLTWDNGTRYFEIPSVIGEGDLSRAPYEALTDPGQPEEEEQATCVGQNDPIEQGKSCCSGLIEAAGVCVACTAEGQNLPTGGACCSGLTAVAGVCINNCKTSGQTVNTSLGETCCSGLSAVSGVCTTTSTACKTSGQTVNTGAGETCCSGLTEDTNTHTCVSSGTCKSYGETATGGDTCCSGLEKQGNTCVYSCAGSGTVPVTNQSCCSGLSPTGTGGACESASTCKNYGETATGQQQCCAGLEKQGNTCVWSCSTSGNTPPSGGSCCSGLTLVNNVCTIPCSTAGQTPGSGGYCCSGLGLQNGVCQVPCTSNGNAPAGGSSCCSGTVNVSGICRTCTASGSVPPYGADQCCAGKGVFTNGGNIGQCKN